MELRKCVELKFWMMELNFVELEKCVELEQRGRQREPQSADVVDSRWEFLELEQRDPADC